MWLRGRAEKEENVFIRKFLNQLADIHLLDSILDGVFFFPISFWNFVVAAFVSAHLLSSSLKGLWGKNLNQRKMEMEVINKEDEQHKEKVADVKQPLKDEAEGRDPTWPQITTLNCQNE